MPLLAFVAVPLIPLACLALLLILDHLEDSLNGVQRRRHRRSGGDAAAPAGVALAGGSTNR